MNDPEDGVPERIRVPLFPLNDLVLLPGIVGDLHVFEPRYREMLQVALAGDRRIAMAVHRLDRSVDSEGVPEIEPLICVGEVTAHRPLPDGRSLIRLEGEFLATVLDESRSASFRVADAVPRPATCVDVETVRRRWIAAVEATGESAAELTSGSDDDPITVLDRDVYRWMAALPLGTPERIAAIRIEDVGQRIEFVSAAFRRLQAPPDPSLN